MHITDIIPCHWLIRLKEVTNTWEFTLEYFGLIVAPINWNDKWTVIFTVVRSQEPKRRIEFLFQNLGKKKSLIFIDGH